MWFARVEHPGGKRDQSGRKPRPITEGKAVVYCDFIDPAMPFQPLLRISHTRLQGIFGDVTPP